MSLRRRNIRKYNRLFIVNHKLRKMAKKMIDTQPEINKPKDGVACYMLAKAFKTHGVITNLAKSGYSEDAEMLTRTLFDIALIISSCLKDKTDETAMKYLNFDYSIRSKMFQQLKDTGKFDDYFEERKNNPKLGDEPIEEIIKNAEKGVQEYGGDFRRKWHSGQTTSQLADSVNLQRYFKTAFSLQSQLVHSLPRSINFYLINKAGQIKMSVEPREDGIKLALVSSFNMLIVILEQFNNHFKVLSDKDLRKIANEWMLIFK
jgi:uncharacterized protein DUF5677